MSVYACILYVLNGIFSYRGTIVAGLMVVTMVITTNRYCTNTVFISVYLYLSTQVCMY